jgi:hypothetical protein
MGVLDDLVNSVSSFHEFYNSAYTIAPKMFAPENSSTMHLCSPYSYGNDLSEVRSSSGSLYSRMRVRTLTVRPLGVPYVLIGSLSKKTL